MISEFEAEAEMISSFQDAGAFFRLGNILILLH